MSLTWCFFVLQKILKPSNPSNIRLMSVDHLQRIPGNARTRWIRSNIRLTIRGRINSGASIRSTAIPLSSTEFSSDPPFHLRLTSVQRIEVYLRHVSAWLHGAESGTDCIRLTIRRTFVQRIGADKCFWQLAAAHGSRNHFPTTPTTKTGERESIGETKKRHIWPPLILKEEKGKRNSIIWHLLLRIFRERV